MWDGGSVTVVDRAAEVLAATVDNDRQGLQEWWEFAQALADAGLLVADIEAHTTPELSALPCPSCGQRQIATLMLRSADGRHQHTRYICTHWEPQIGADGQLVPGNGWCGWEGWSVPGWDTIAAEDRAGTSVAEDGPVQ